MLALFCPSLVRFVPFLVCLCFSSFLFGFLDCVAHVRAVCYNVYSVMISYRPLSVEPFTDQVLRRITMVFFLTGVIGSAWMGE